MQNITKNYQWKAELDYRNTEADSNLIMFQWMEVNKAMAESVYIVQEIQMPL